MQILKAKLQALKAKLQSLVRPKIFWPTVAILLIACTTLYVLKEKEKTLKMAVEKELGMTIEEKRVVEINLAQAKKGILSRDEQIKLVLAKLEKEIAARQGIEAELLLVTKQSKGLEVKIEELTAALPENIELERIVVKNIHTLTGKVLVFDKENDFVIVNLGSRNNLNPGDVLSVYRDDRLIGRAQIEKVDEKTSAAVILSPWKDVKFAENDVVKKL